MARLTIKEKPIWKEVRGDLERGSGGPKGEQEREKERREKQRENQNAIFNQLVLFEK